MSKNKKNQIFLSKKNLDSPITEKELLKIFKGIPEYAPCNIKEFFIYHFDKSYLEYYEPIDSNKQFKALLKLSKYFPIGHHLEFMGFNIINRLLDVVCKKKKYTYHQKVLWVMRTSENDDQVYDFLKRTYRISKFNNYGKKKLRLLMNTKT